MGEKKYENRVNKKKWEIKKILGRYNMQYNFVFWFVPFFCC